MDCDAVLDSLLAGVGVSLKKPSPSAPSSPASSVSVSELCGSPSFPSSVDLGALLSPQLPVAGSVPEPPAAPTRKSQKGKGRKRAATEEEKKQRQVERYY